MKFGFIVPNGSTDQILEMAGEIEASGWDGFFYWDGIGGDYDMNVFDPWAILAAAAIRTKRITLGVRCFFRFRDGVHGRLRAKPLRWTTSRRAGW